MVFQIRATTSRYGMETLLLSSLLLVCVMTFNALTDGDISLVEIFLLSTALAGMVLGYFKLKQPFYSLSMSAESLSYHHPYGGWQLPLANFKKAGIPFVINGYDEIPLSVVGIQLYDVDAFLSSLSPRMAAKLLVEQRHWHLAGVKAHCKNGNCPDEWLIECDSFVSDAGIRYTGLLAMFANRMIVMRKLLGYELIIPATALDRDSDEFVYFLMRWQRDPEATVKQACASQTA